MDALTTTLGYVHGYSEYETRRLADQADTLAALLHAGTAYPAADRVLEVGCGVGAQTAHLVRSSPGARLVAVDLAEDSLAKARARVAARAPGAVVHWLRADLHQLPFPDAWFDHLFVCFVLEHLPDPVRALAGLRRVLRPGGTITVIEAVRDEVLSAGLCTTADWQRGIADLRRTALDGGTFHYTFLKAFALNPD
jgi:ubiquinone/menaquinone biosynthesis C-methylase UbiE